MFTTKLADWITIITGPLTVLSTGAALIQKVPLQRGNSQEAVMQLTALALATIVVAWCFLFWGQLRISLRFAKKHDSLSSFLFSILTCTVGLAIFVSVELLLLDAILGTAELWYWLSIPAIIWVAAGFFGVLIVGSNAED